MKQPCDKYCEGRNAECHAFCEKWKAWEEWKFKEYDKANFERDIQGFLGKMEKDRVSDIKAGRLTSRKNKKR